ncbi:organic cation transporter protein-like [Neocloeon triangulifer]|uniref:organic cation transporter protein-like n=1 Tax=Neocloeon triangulifer TaxID=2078957 RepID=UPI00286EE6C9|nr:organic cation transporter protein-like [Neocloeon triangulifer]
MWQSDPVTAALGSFGVWQGGSLFLIALVKVPAAWHMLSILFLAPNPETFGGTYFCARNDSESQKLVAPSEWIDRWHPKDKRYALGFNPCNTFLPGDIRDGNSSTSELIKCDNFEFLVQYPTMVSQWSLVCDRSVLVNVVQFFYLLGITGGGIITYFISKKLSPRVLILGGATLQVTAGVALALQPIFEVHCLLKSLIGLGLCFMFTATHQIIFDLTAGWRKIVLGVSFEHFWSIGVISLGWLHSIAGSWTNLQLIISVPSIIFLILFCFVPDSPRWLIAHKQFGKADELLIFAAHCNGKKLPNDFTTKKLASGRGNEKPVEMKTSKFRIICAQIIWIGTVVNYYGALLNIKNVGGTSLPLRTTISGFAEIVGTFSGMILLLKPKYKFGFLSLLLFVGGTCCVCSWLIPPNESGGRAGWTMVWLAFVGRIAIACSLAMMSNGASAQLIAPSGPFLGMILVTVARMCLMAAPFLNSLAFYGESITLSFYGGLALMAASAAFALFISSEWRIRELVNAINNTPTGKVWSVHSQTTSVSEEKVVCTNINWCFEDDDGNVKLY